mmetsp:Transcript_34387/g.41145  ORF Transcript_34387/g.41145 Transcript_34387/m.41145 type:complete len:132 (-) Transcript_34387:17-412(-)
MGLLNYYDGTLKIQQPSSFMYHSLQSRLPFDKGIIRSWNQYRHSFYLNLVLLIQPAHLWGGMDSWNHIVKPFHDSSKVCVRLMRIFFLLRAWSVIAGVILDTDVPAWTGWTTTIPYRTLLVGMLVRILLKC